MSSLDDALSKLQTSDAPTAVDIPMKLLSNEDVLMHTEILDPRTMNQLALMINYCKQKGGYNQEKDSWTNIYWKHKHDLWETTYKARALHMVSYQRKRPKEIVGMFASLQQYLFNQPVADGKLKVKNR